MCLLFLSPPPLYFCLAFPGEKAQFCSNHKMPGMVDVHNKRCEAEDCQKHPTYGIANGRARFCTKHKGPDMVRLINIYNTSMHAFGLASKPVCEFFLYICIDVVLFFC